MRRVRWTETASRDLRGAEDYLNGNSPAVGSDLVVRAITATGFLVVHPGIGAPVGRSRWRKWRVPRTRYLLLYCPVPDGIEIGRVRHDRSSWQLVPD